MSASRKRFFANNRGGLASSNSTYKPKAKPYKGTSATPTRIKRKNKYGVTRVGRRQYTLAWPELSKAVKRERGNRCERCPSKDNLEVHHIIPISKGGKDIRSNLIVLCGRCHDKRHRHLRGREHK